MGSAPAFGAGWKFCPVPLVRATDNVDERVLFVPMRRYPRRQQRRRQTERGGASWRLFGLLALLVLVNAYVFLFRSGTSLPEVMDKAAVEDPEPLRGEDARPLLAATLDAAQGSARDAAAQGAPWQEGTIGKGDSLGRVLRREGVRSEDSVEVIRAVKKHLDFRKIHVGQKYRVQRYANGRLARFEFEVSSTVRVEAVREPGGAFVGNKTVADTDIKILELGATVKGSLYGTIKAMGEDTRLVGFFVDVFAYDLNFYVDQHPGDKFRMLVEKEYLDGTFLRYRRVLAAEYSGKAGTFRAFQWKVPGARKAKYFDERGESIEKTFLKTPLKFTRITSGFSRSRMHPILHKRTAHLGVDYAAPKGTPIRAAADGEIVFRGWRGGAGNCVILNHDNGMQTIYMHMSRFRRGQKKGQRVAQKSVIGYVGSTGMSTGNHLHFSVKKKGKYVDPLKLKMARGASVPRKHRAQFKRETREFIQRLSETQVKPAAAREILPSELMSPSSADGGVPAQP